MLVETFVGPSNVNSALTFDADRTINEYIEPQKPGNGGKSDVMLVPAPGLTLFAAVPGSSVPLLFQQDGRAFGVAGDQFIEIFADASWTSYGTVSVVTDVYPTLCSNGTAGFQLFLTAGLNGYIFDLNTNTLTLIADPDFPQGQALMGEFMDGYFLVLVSGTRRFQISALEDGTSWDGLDVAERSEASDNLSAMRRNHREIWFQGTLTSEVWYDNGDPLFPFAPIQGVFLEEGVPSSWTTRRFNNTLVYVAKNQDGAGIVMRADGYNPVRTSTHAVELAIQNTGLATARAWVYQERGHLFYLLHLPTNETTFVYDVALDRWAERATLVDDSVEPWVWAPNRPISHCFAFQKHLVGDISTGTIYEQSVTIFTQELAV